MIYYSVHYYVLNVDAGFNSPDQIPSRSEVTMVLIYYSVHYYVLNVDAGFNSPDQIPSRSHYGQ